MKATGLIPCNIDFSHPVSARQARPGLITRGSFHVRDSQSSPKSPDSTLHHIEARAARMSPPKDDVFTLGDYSILTLNPAVFAP